ncbi:MAG: rhamnan synthesis F family protein [Methylomicrobium sp.]
MHIEMTLRKDIKDIAESGFFDQEWYKTQYSYLIKDNVNLIEHYLKIGANLGLNPSPLFDTNAYLKLYKDVEKAQMNPLLHYVKSGRNEGRSPKGIESNNSLSGGSRRLSRFGGTEYGNIDYQIFYDEKVIKKDYSKIKLCIHLHLFHQEMAEEFIKYLNFIPHHFTLLISICSPSSVNLATYFKSRISNVTQCLVKEVENRGRDVAPWIIDFRGEILNHDLFLHVHSKRSDYKASYNGWRRFLIHNSFGSQNIATSILNIFEEHKDVGLVYPPYFSALPNQPKWGANKERFFKLLEQLNFCEALDKCPDFPSGSFFWARVACLKPILNMGLTRDDFETEEGQLDGTLGHAIERLLGLLPQSCGMKSNCVSVDVSYNLINYWDNKRFENLKFYRCGEIKKNILPRRSLTEKYKIAVFTCITGDFDEFVSTPVIEDGVDYFFFSDKECFPPYPYSYLPCRYIDPNPRRTARFVKTHPHFHLNDYDYTVWIDGNIVSLNGILNHVQYVIDSGSDLGLIAHPIRTSFVDEAEECIRIKADDQDVLCEQRNLYLEKGLDSADLIETNVIISHQKSEKVRLFYDIWWREICRYSYRDQISVNFALRESGAKFVHIFPPGNSIRDQEEFCIFSHDLKSRDDLLFYLQSQNEGDEE